MDKFAKQRTPCGSTFISIKHKKYCVYCGEEIREVYGIGDFRDITVDYSCDCDLAKKEIKKNDYNRVIGLAQNEYYYPKNLKELMYEYEVEELKSKYKIEQKK